MQSPQLASRMVQAAVRTDGSELKRDLDAATWQKLQAFAAQNALPLAQMQGMKPWFVGLSISIGQMQKLGLDPALGLDRHFMERAQKTGRKTAGLEDIDTQIGMLDGMTVQEQRQMLSEALDQAGKGDEQARLLHDAWRRGDERLLWTKMAAEMRQQYPQLYQRINTGRNDAWVPKLLPYLQAGQGGTLVVVGTLHLLGNDGVVEKLKAKGYKVERVARRFRIHRGDGSAAGLAAGAAPRFVGLVAGAGAGTRSGAARARATETAAHAALEFLPQLQVALGQLVHHRPRGLPQQVAHLLAELLLLVEEDLHAALQVIAHEALQGIAVEADQLAQQLAGPIE
ncbi:hypothetical protein G6F31_014814 [Rhizopus arrhizus]|nr:hypothetical protein G6F31_014814 [Rhizopus arrhizus]